MSWSSISIIVILFLTYKRFETSIQVFESIKKAKPKKLYFASNAPKNIKEQWLNYINNLVKTEVKPFDKKYSKWMFDITRRVHNKGIKIMAGTDTPIFFLTPGLSLHEELAVLVEAGLSPLEALKSATTNPAAYFNLDNELGKIAINNWADLVILDANPLDDINNTKQINAVIKQGKYLNREHLDGLLNNLTTKE